jgi:hypothetical protein
MENTNGNVNAVGMSRTLETFVAMLTSSLIILTNSIIVNCQIHAPHPLKGRKLSPRLLESFSTVDAARHYRQLGNGHNGLQKSLTPPHVP